MTYIAEASNNEGCNISRVTYPSLAQNAELSHAKLAIATDDDVYRFLEVRVTHVQAFRAPLTCLQDKDIPDDMQAMLLAMMPEIEVDSNGGRRVGRVTNSHR